ncbi:MAG: transposase [Brumimicrobium sp.]|nr:transposase [Brumimicrobium sp.]
MGATHGKNRRRKSQIGQWFFISKVSYYEAKNCKGCPLKCLCYKAKANRRIEINHNLNRHKERVRQLLTSEEGLYHRSKRPIEPESVFGQGKSNKQYYRFRHFGKDLITMDFAIFAIAFNIGKMYKKGKITPKNSQKSADLLKINLVVLIFTQNHKINHAGTTNPKLAA